MLFIYAGKQVIEHALKTKSEAGVKCSNLLCSGGAIPDDLVLKMIEDKVNSQEVANCGKYFIYIILL